MKNLEYFSRFFISDIEAHILEYLDLLGKVHKLIKIKEN